MTIRSALKWFSNTVSVNCLEPCLGLVPWPLLSSGGSAAETRGPAGLQHMHNHPGRERRASCLGPHQVSLPSASASGKSSQLLSAVSSTSHSSLSAVISTGCQGGYISDKMSRSFTPVNRNFSWIVFMPKIFHVVSKFFFFCLHSLLLGLIAI